MNEVLKRIEEVAKDACKEQSLSLYGVEMKSASKGLIVIVYITKISGVTIDDCKSVSRYISNVLDQEDFIESTYFLEVSSPGLERDLKFKSHYASAIGEILKITYHNEMGKNVTQKGELLEVLPDSIKIKEKEEIVEIQFTSIKKAKTYFDYKRK